MIDVLASNESPAHRMMRRLDELVKFSDEDGALTRLYLSKAHREAAKQFIAWCAEAGVDAKIDASGNVWGRYEGKAPGAPALMLGSHIDTVRNAGRYDGNLGALAALAVVEALAASGERLDHAVEIVAFGDEEGVRFPTTLTGSRALAGLFARAALDQKDADGVTMRDALVAFGCDPDGVGALRGRNIAAFVELHIEQGPVLEAENLAVGVVTAINGATRLHAKVVGLAGHSGAVPMGLRRDALTAAAEMMLLIEARARIEDDLVGTVGRVDVEPGAVNVIPGEVRFTVDIRAPRDEQRRRAVSDISKRLSAIAATRNVELTLTQTHEAGAYACHASVIAGLKDSVERVYGAPARLLPSGAGHDTMVMGQLCPAGMLFLRCKGGISHNPEESITTEDAEVGLTSLIDFTRHFQAGPKRAT
ncbi:MAG TPA: allantoate amidohydrolase [Roseiarcus sp.]|nr:allantoate amidohydrolase [Roseiarcus sp.]